MDDPVPPRTGCRVFGHGRRLLGFVFACPPVPALGSPALNDDTKIQVQQATDLVELIGEHLSLKPRGKEFIGLCPFHDDSSPSMYVSPAKQIFKCFSCGAGGDAFSFVMKYHKMDFREALEHLAQRSGIELKPMGQRESKQASERQRVKDANEQALKFFRAMLSKDGVGDTARDYLNNRGVSDEMLERFQLGYAPDAWDELVRAARVRKWDERGLLAAGLLKARDSGGSYDAMRHRLIFPILDRLGRPIAFGGRKLRDEDEPKYLNSPETALFHKSRALYGIHAASQAIMKTRTAVIVEGYTDVIACHQAGFENVVATLGTSLTREHAGELRRYAERVVLVFDGDEAGMKAADRAIEVFLTAEVDVAIAVLPGGQDPADLLKNHEDGPQQWERAINDAVDALDYQLARLKKQWDEAGSITGKQQQVEAFLQRLAELGIAKSHPIRRGIVVNRVAELTGLTDHAVSDILERLKPRPPRKAAQPQPGPQKPSPGGAADIDDLNARVAAEAHAMAEGDAGPMEDDADMVLDAGVPTPRIRALQRAEREYLGALLRDGSLFAEVTVDGQHLDEAITPVDLFTHSGRRLYQRMFDALCAGESVSLNQLCARLSELGESDLSELAIAAESEAEDKCGDSHDRLRAMGTDAARALIRRQQQVAYEQTKNKPADNDPKSAAAKLAAVREHLGQSPSPVRIMRVRK